MICCLERIRKNVCSFPKFMPTLKEYLFSLCHSFQGGQVSLYWNEWAKLTSDKHILSDICVFKIECTETPAQHLVYHKPDS